MNDTLDEQALRIAEAYRVSKDAYAFNDAMVIDFARRLHTEWMAQQDPDDVFRNLNFIVQYQRKDHLHSWIAMLAFDVEDLALLEKRDCEGASRPWEYRLIRRDGSVIEAPRSEDELRNTPATPVAKPAAQEPIAEACWPLYGEPLLIWHGAAPERPSSIMLYAAPVTQQEPVAWRWDEATYTENDVRGRCWQYNIFGTQKPNAPWMQRNVTPLYAAPVVQDCVSVPRELIDRFPEINPSNYDHDDACALNAWGVEVVLAASKEKT